MQIDRDVLDGGSLLMAVQQLSFASCLATFHRLHLVTPATVTESFASRKWVRVKERQRPYLIRQTSIDMIDQRDSSLVDARA